ncbi:hypothetical protein [Metabacillus sp. 84]|uniref:hypothetical protein n=1 Tax=unclassified Metabacillus TaxID=2675274 RepID=UPI003CE6E2A8
MDNRRTRFAIKAGWLGLTGLVNILAGFLFLYLSILWMITFMYAAEAFGWTLDPTLDEGLLLPCLMLSGTAIIFYFPALIMGNRHLRSKGKLGKPYDVLYFVMMFAIGIGLALKERGF